MRPRDTATNDIRKSIEAQDSRTLSAVCSWKDINEHFHDGETVMHIAAYHCPPPFLERLLDAGANPNAEGWDGVTPLHRAAMGNFPENIPLLLSRGADRSIKRRSTGMTAEDIALRRHNEKAIAYLKTS